MNSQTLATAAHAASGAPHNTQSPNSASKPKKSGYYALAELMAPDRGFAQFKRFARLNSHSLLIQQAELLYLESQLQTTAVFDENEGLEHSTNVEALLDSAEKGQGDEQWKLILQTREKLKEYNEALLRQAEIWNLPAPRKSDSRFLREWLARKDCGDNFLKGHEQLPFYEEEASDLVTVSERKFDSLTAWIAEKFLPWAVNIGLIKRTAVPGYETAGLINWPDNYFLRAAQTTAVITSALIPSLAILILYFVPSTLGRMFVAMALSFLFSASLAVATIARPVEVFAATAAFAAVQVVFIGSTSTRHV